MYLLQIEGEITAISLLITAITALAGTIVFLFMYNKSLNKEIKSMGDIFANKLQEIYKDQIKDSKAVIEKNTSAVDGHTNAVEENSEISKELKNAISVTSAEQTKALQELRLWLRENFARGGNK